MAYGAGALVSPLVATQFSEMKHWSFHYLTSLGVAVINLLLVLYAFRFKPIETLFSEAGYVEATVESEKEITVTATESNSEKVEDVTSAPGRHIDPEGSPTENDVVQVTNQPGSAQKMGQIIRDPVVLLISFFAFVYVGLEITIGGWIVTFLRTVRGAGPSAGYVSSGFFGGLTLGRVLHVWVARRVPERYVLFVYGIAAIALQIVSAPRMQYHQLGCDSDLT
ncbi:hypothetical protein QFC22_004218 [Naganishia vaughanmartiniae]|uniref:Uncharacterized protein n=1 Tax=Naganishia vaughanmartiniae TaxID=1424756 RepID=A0ACC2X6C5_9TREE|nr:hypothetical protein QFC22_004218 [Naganishia vaughanmartiniae]